MCQAFCQNISASIVNKMGSDPSTSASVSAAAVSAPRLLSQPVWFTENNLHPATVQVATFGLTVGMILLVVFTWSSWMATYGRAQITFLGSWMPIALLKITSLSPSLTRCLELADPFWPQE
mmetsp:Transcript_4762/g.14641  ORF Transcript_4762/g.14641 Transcript_4762/m.14641 type:complete len:121 (+) Transcript_4762:708-1070(+)